MFQITNSHCCLELIHLCIATNKLYRLRTVDAKILHIIQELNPCIVLEADTTSLNGIEYFCSMETKHRSISKASRRYAFILYCKSMCCIIDNLQSILFSNTINFLYITHVAINMYRNDCHCVIRNQIFKFLCINRVIIFFNITENWNQSISNNRMCRGSKSKWSGNNLATLRQI